MCVHCGLAHQAIHPFGVGQLVIVATPTASRGLTRGSLTWPADQRRRSASWIDVPLLKVVQSVACSWNTMTTVNTCHAVLVGTSYVLSASGTRSIRVRQAKFK